MSPSPRPLEKADFKMSLVEPSLMTPAFHLYMKSCLQHVAETSYKSKVIMDLNSLNVTLYTSNKLIISLFKKKL